MKFFMRKEGDLAKKVFDAFKLDNMGLNTYYISLLKTGPDSFLVSLVTE